MYVFSRNRGKKPHVTVRHYSTTGTLKALARIPLVEKLPDKTGIYSEDEWWELTLKEAFIHVITELLGDVSQEYKAWFPSHVVERTANKLAQRYSYDFAKTGRVQMKGSVFLDKLSEGRRHG